MKVGMASTTVPQRVHTPSRPAIMLGSSSSPVITHATDATMTTIKKQLHRTKTPYVETSSTRSTHVAAMSAASACE